MEITSQQYLATSRGVETTRPSPSYFQTVQPHRTASAINPANQEQSAAQQREAQQYEQAVQQQIQKLSARDREVRTHEAAHIAAGGQYVSGGPTFTYQRGPNGRYYAIGGEVQLDVSAIPSDPQATLDKAEVIQRAALAPAQPSPQDLRVAANAARLASRARLEIAIQQREQVQEQQQARRSGGDSDQDNARGASEVDDRLTGFAGYTSTGLAEPAREVFDIVA